MNLSRIHRVKPIYFHSLVGLEPIRWEERSISDSKALLKAACNYLTKHFHHQTRENKFGAQLIGGKTLSK